MRALLIKAFRGQFVVEALVRFRSLLILPIATRLLGPTGYGWIAFAAAVTGLVGAVATLGMPAAIARFLPGKETDDERAAMFWPAFAACALTVTAFAGLTIAAFAFGHLAPKGIPFGLVVLAAANVVSNELKLFLYGFWRYNVELTPYYRFM
ncbi:MAG: Polysaccharide biosynthesis protein, partial [Gaiellaceae bacterium]|nr:Polysaccharide biosynthesis protein [Gaiellaceae bacterium]